MLTIVRSCQMSRFKTLTRVRLAARILDWHDNLLNSANGKIHRALEMVTHPRNRRSAKNFHSQEKSRKTRIMRAQDWICKAQSLIRWSVEDNSQSSISKRSKRNRLLKKVALLITLAWCVGLTKCTKSAARSQSLSTRHKAIHSR